MGKQGFGSGTFQMKGLDADQRYFIRLLAQNKAGEFWTGEESIINEIPIPDDFPGSLFLWFDANDLNAKNEPKSFTPDVGFPVNLWKNKARKSDSISENNKDLTIPSDDFPYDNFPTIAHHQDYGIAVVDFDGDDYLENSYVINSDSGWSARGFSAFAVTRYTGGKNGRVITSGNFNWLMGHHGGSNGSYYFNGWVDQGYEMDQKLHLFEVLHQGRNDATDPTARVWNDGIPGSYKLSLIHI